MTQLVFDLPHRPALGREDFLVAPSNAKATALIDAWPQWPSPVLVVVGPQGSGKSHLAEVWRAASGAIRAVSGDLAVERVPELLQRGAAVIEDLPGAGFEERALFHLLNLAREQGAFVLLTSSDYPAHWPVALPDLETRLKAAPVALLEAPDDALLRAVLVKLFADRQLTVSDDVLSYLIARMERSLAAANRLVAELDRTAFAAKSGITKPLAGRVLADHAAGDEGDA